MPVFPANFNVTSLNGLNGFSITGFPVSSSGGYSVSGIGDINQDGMADFAVGAVNDDDRGACYVIFGQYGIGNSGNFDVSRLTGANGFSIVGFPYGGSGGNSISGAGDINGDGIADLAIGAPYAFNLTGRAYVIFGQPGIGNLGSFNISYLNGSNGFIIDGFPLNSMGGLYVSEIGDLNSDGIGDLAVGAPDASLTSSYSGATYVIFGKAGQRSSLSLSVASLAGSTGFAIVGYPTEGYGGYSVNKAGDINADGIADLVIGAPFAYATSGAAYVIFGKSGIGSTGSLNIASLTGANGFLINSFPAPSLGGYSISGAGDVNGDGVADLVVGAGAANSLTGEGYVIFGHSGIGSTGSLVISSLTGSNGFAITGFPPNSQGAWTVSGAGDINADGIEDLFVGAPYAFNRIGLSYIIFGKSGIGSTGVLSVTSLTGSNGFAIVGFPPESLGGWAGDGAGDINGDGIVDLVVGAPFAPINYTGTSYVIFGESSFTVKITENNLLVKEGQTLLFGSQYLNATASRSIMDLGLQFNLNNIQHGRFFSSSNPNISLTSFIQQQVRNSQILFAHDGSSWAPAYNVTVSHLEVKTPSQAAKITFLQSFVLVNHNLSINQGQKIVVTSSNLSANDLYSPANNPNLIFSVSNVQHGYFALINSPTTPITSFTQAQVQSGNIQFVHDNSSNPPSFSVGVINGKASISSQPATISFDISPVLLTNNLRVGQGRTVVLSSYNLNATDPFRSGNFTFLLYNVRYGYFAFINKPLAAITSFTQAQVKNGLVEFTQDGTVNPPSYEVSVSDGRVTSGAQVGGISFQVTLILTHNELTLDSGQSVLLTPQNLNVTDLNENNPSNIIFIVAAVANGYFAYSDTPTLPILSFSEHDIYSAQVEFVSDGSNQAPSYSIAVSDGVDVLDPSAANITFAKSPQILTNQLTISQGATQPLNLNHLHATLSGTSSNATILFLVNSVHHGYFENDNQPGTLISNFTQQQIISQNIQFVHDGSNFAPGYSITAAFITNLFSFSKSRHHLFALAPAKASGYYSALSAAEIWFQVGGITLPYLKNNRLYIKQGGTVILSPQNLLAVDMKDSPVLNSTFLINSLTHGRFTSVSAPVAYLNFSQSQVAAGEIQFVHDGSANVPSYQVIVNQGPYFSAPYQASIAFQPIYSPPKIIGQLPNQTITVDEAFSFPLVTSVFSDATPLHFSASGVGGSQLPSWIHFDNITNYFSGLATISGMTSVQVTARNAAHLTASAFFLLTAQTQSQFQSHAASLNTALIGGVVGGGAAVLMLIAMRCYIGRKAHRHWKQAIDADATQKITRVLAKEIFEKVKLTGCCGYLDESTAKAYVKAIESIVSKLDSVDKTQSMTLIEEIATQIKKQANKLYCYSFFKPGITPQELSDKAATIAQSVQQVLSTSDDIEMSDVRVLSA